MSIEEKCTYNGLEAEDSCGVQGGDVVRASSVVDFENVNYWCMIVRGVLWLGRLGLVKFDTKVGYVVFHCDPESALDVVPLKIDARV